eukprot:6402952-Prymnesium_polylepis.2
MSVDIANLRSDRVVTRLKDASSRGHGDNIPSARDALFANVVGVNTRPRPFIPLSKHTVLR